MTHADQIRLHLTRFIEAVNEGKALDAHDATSALMALRARMPRPASLPAPLEVVERAQ